MSSRQRKLRSTILPSTKKGPRVPTYKSVRPHLAAANRTHWNSAKVQRLLKEQPPWLADVIQYAVNNIAQAEREREELLVRLGHKQWENMCREMAAAAPLEWVFRNEQEDFSEAFTLQWMGMRIGFYFTEEYIAANLAKLPSETP